MGRSQRAALFLLQQGFTQVTNIQAGIDAWSIAVDLASPLLIAETFFLPSTYESGLERCLVTTQIKA